MVAKGVERVISAYIITSPTTWWSAPMAFSCAPRLFSAPRCMKHRGALEPRTHVCALHCTRPCMCFINNALDGGTRTSPTPGFAFCPGKRSCSRHPSTDGCSGYPDRPASDSVCPDSPPGFRFRAMASGSFLVLHAHRLLTLFEGRATICSDGFAPFSLSPFTAP